MKTYRTASFEPNFQPTETFLFCTVLQRLSKSNILLRFLIKYIIIGKRTMHFLKRKINKRDNCGPSKVWFELRRVKTRPPRDWGREKSRGGRLRNRARPSLSSETRGRCCRTRPTGIYSRSCRSCRCWTRKLDNVPVKVVIKVNNLQSFLYLEKKLFVGFCRLQHGS
jgi:hypothetical protein